MRKYILIAAFVLVSATAQGGVTRGLTLASNDEPAAAAQPKAVEAPNAVEPIKPAETPKYIERPAAVETTTVQPKVEQAKPAAERDIQMPKAEKPKRRRQSTEARIIYELHRHGIYR